MTAAGRGRLAAMAAVILMLNGAGWGSIIRIFRELRRDRCREEDLERQPQARGLM